MKSFVSVIIPTLNEEKYIEQTLKSLRCQDYKGKYEIIVCDGNSKDKTVKIAKKYADKVIIVKKKCAAIEKNAGAKVAKGEILLFIDADTIPLYNTISEFAKVFKKNKTVEAACPILPITSNARYFMLYWAANQFMKASIKTKNPRFFGCCAYRKNVFERIGGFDEKFNTHEDIDLSKRISKFGQLIFTDKTFVLTSTRRLKTWGPIKSAKNYVSFYLKYLITGKGTQKTEYMPIR